MTDSFRNELHRAAAWSMVVSVLLIVVGAIAIAMPMIVGIAITALFGWLLIFAGILHLALAWGGGRSAAVIWEILLGLVYGAVGVYMLVNPLVGLESLTLVVAIYLLFEGVLEVILSLQVRPAPGASWLLFDSLLTLVLAILVSSTWPSSSAWVVGTVVGISMLLSGITRLMFANSVRRVTV
jgi:uncharacterized membrane protein HdeD (DUF308 family)